MVKGRGDAWSLVDWEDEVTLDLWDLCWFQDKLYVATMSALFTLDGNRLLPVDFGEMGPVTCSRPHDGRRRAVVDRQGRRRLLRRQRPGSKYD